MSLNDLAEKWLCVACKFLLGYVEDKRIVRIKRKDLYVSCEGGRVTVNCPRCGKLNILEDENDTTIKDIKG